MQTHNAGRHFAVAEALMHGYHAAVVGRSSLIEVNGHQALVQVAAKGAWQIEDVDSYTAGKIECMVLVNLTDDTPQYYICPGDQLRDDVRKRYDEFLASKGGTRPRNPASKHAAIYPEHVRKWRNDWNQLA
jgi:hypothetical protein